MLKTIKQIVMKKSNKFRFIDLFAGIGGFHIAMHELGGRCVFASEIDKFARITYEHNFRNKSPEIFLNGNFNEDLTDLKLNYADIPDFDILCAGFPCQPFSHAGLKKGFDDTRGTLFFNIKEIVKAKLQKAHHNNYNSIPKILFLENVKGFKNHDNGKTYNIVERTLRYLGYHVKSEVLNSKHFGLPQNRERIYIVAWHIDSINNSEFRFPYGLDHNNNIIFNKNEREIKSRNTTVGQILLTDDELSLHEANNNKSYTLSEKLWNGHKRRKQQHLQKGYGFGFSVFNSESPYTSTISARYYKDGSEILIENNGINGKLNRPRKLHPIEAARLQGFPIDDWFEIPVSDNQAYKQFGNSVPVPVVKTIASEIIKQLLTK